MTVILKEKPMEKLTEKQMERLKEIQMLMEIEMEKHLKRLKG